MLRLWVLCLVKTTRGFGSSHPNPNTQLPPPGQYGGGDSSSNVVCLPGDMEAFMARQLENSDSDTLRAISASWSSSQTH